MFEDFFSRGLLPVVAALVTSACSAAPHDTANSTSSKLSYDENFACDTDDDCVAIDQLRSCSSHGARVAVNRWHVSDYRSAQVCATGPAVSYDRTLVAECNQWTWQCEMGYANYQPPINPGQHEN
jgi:hypothetical protein